MLHIDKFWLLVILILTSFFVLSTYFYPKLPEQIPTHWNIKGEVDGYMKKEFGLLVMPALSVLIVILLAYLPKMDPLKKNYSFFMPYFKGFIVVFSFFSLYIHMLIIAAGLGYAVEINHFLLPAFGLLFIYISLLLKKSKRNWFVGIRTPWTLSSDKVWEKTNKAGSIVFLIHGLLFLFVVTVVNLLPTIILALILSIIISSIILCIYSYLLYVSEKKNK
ncbi:MAG: DUF1648 domain-containing protein [Candidatus Diapherotrites archaeon]